MLFALMRLGIKIIQFLLIVTLPLPALVSLWILLLGYPQVAIFIFFFGYFFWISLIKVLNI